MSSVRLAGVVKRCGDVVAVAGVDLEVESGEFLVVLAAVGVRQDHADAHRGWAGDPDRRTGAHPGSRRHRSAAAQARIIVALGLSNSLLSLIVVYPTITVPFSAWLLIGFFKSIPPETEESALCDGYHPCGACLRVAVPLARPASSP